MPTMFTAATGEIIVQGDAVCLASTTPDQVRKAVPAALANARTVLGVARQVLPSGNVRLNTVGEVVESTITGLVPGASSLVAVDANARLVRVPKPNGSEYFVGTCDARGHVCIQARMSRDVSPQHVFNVKAYGATATSDGNGGGTDDSAAFQAAIDAAAAYIGPGGVSNSGAEVVIPPGRYRLSSVLNVKSVHLRGVHGGVYGSSILVFDKDVGARVDSTPTGEGGCIVVPSGVSSQATPGDGAVIERLYIKQASGGDPLKLCHGIKVLGSCELRDLSVEGFQGDGIHIVGETEGGSNANGWCISGRVIVARCGRYGVISHGKDSSAGTMAGSLITIGNGSWGVYEASFGGSNYAGAIDAEGNGVYTKRSPTPPASGSTPTLTLQKLGSSGQPIRPLKWATSACPPWQTVRAFSTERSP